MYHLPPAIHPTIARLLGDKSRIAEWIRAFGSPLNAVFPEQVHVNVSSFEEVLVRHQLPHRIFCAHKPTQSSALVRALVGTSVGLDVASVGELRHALGVGFVGDRLIATGPKNAEFLFLALQHNVIISIDSWDELHAIARRAGELAKTVRVLIRLHGFAAGHTVIRSKETRFGIHVNEADALIAYCIANPCVDLLGFAFHLNAATRQEKSIAIEQCIGVLGAAIAAGLHPSVLNIGGGFPIRMVEDRDAWDAYGTALQQSVLGNATSLSWGGSGLGYRVEQGAIAGAASFHDHAVRDAGAAELENILNARLEGFEKQTVAAVLRDMLFELWIEPGQATYDQSGITVASVIASKRSAQGEHVVVLDMNRSNLNTIDLQHMADPVLLAQTVSAEASSEVGVFFAGNLCLGSDMITRHKAYMPQLPQCGDLIAFTNTAAYRMHFAQSRTLLQRVATTIAVTARAGEWQWSIDEQFVSNAQTYGV